MQIQRLLFSKDAPLSRRVCVDFGLAELETVSSWIAAFATILQWLQDWVGSDVRAGVDVDEMLMLLAYPPTTDVIVY